MTGERFRAYVTETLVPTLRLGDTVILDNLGAHKVAGVREAIEAAGARLLYLPPYSPEFNPIELAFAKLKALLRSCGGPHRQRPVGGHPPSLRALLASGVPQLLHGRWIRRRRLCFNLIGRSSKQALLYAYRSNGACPCGPFQAHPRTRSKWMLLLFGTRTWPASKTPLERSCASRMS